jgi:hypothetical protein
MNENMIRTNALQRPPRHHALPLHFSQRLQPNVDEMRKIDTELRWQYY